MDPVELVSSRELSPGKEGMLLRGREMRNALLRPVGAGQDFVVRSPILEGYYTDAYNNTFAFALVKYDRYRVRSRRIRFIQ
jgi:hypothetical protein